MYVHPELGIGRLEQFFNNYFTFIFLPSKLLLSKQY